MVDIEKYVDRNTPVAFQEVRKYFKVYIYSLLNSRTSDAGDGVVDRLQKLGAFTNADVPDEDNPYDGMLLIHKELHPLVARYSEYKYQYIIAYSRLFKDETLFQIISEVFFGVAAYVSYGKTLVKDVVRWTDELHDLRNPVLGYKSTDQGYYTDQEETGMYGLSFSLDCAMDKRLQGRTADQWQPYIDLAMGMLLLTAPARVPVVFHATPYYYVGKNEEFDLHFRVDEAGHLSVVSGTYDVDAFRLVTVGNETYLFYEYTATMLPIFRDGDHIYATMDVAEDLADSPNGFFMESSPFNDETQMGLIHALIEDGQLPGLYERVECDGLSPGIVIENGDFVKIITITTMSAFTFVRISPGEAYPYLPVIYAVFDVNKMPYFGSRSSLYRVKLFVDFR